MKIKFKGKEMSLVGKQLKVGDVMPDFRVVKNDLSDLSLKDTKGTRVFLSVPSIDTGVCSIEVAKFINYFKNLDSYCYVVSKDLPFALSRWCQANASDNVITTSEYKYMEFAKATGTLIEELGLLTRAVFVVDSYNKILHVEYVEEVANEPNYEEVLKFLK